MFLAFILLETMFKCIISNNAPECAYEICKKIYDNIYYCDDSSHSCKDILKSDLRDYIDNYVGFMTTYETNNFLIYYGIDNAIRDYNKKMRIETVDIETSSKCLVGFIIEESFVIISF